MAASNITFDVGLRNPNFKTNNSSDSELSSNYSDEEFKKMPKAPIPKKISSEDTSRKSRPTSVSQRIPRESSMSSVSSQISQSSTSSKKTRKKRKKPKNSVRSSSKGNPDTDHRQIAKELMYLNFPLEENYDFHLVCSRCLKKQKEGTNGYTLESSCPSCAMDQLALKKKSGRYWMKIRKRPDCGIEFSGIYKICFDFRHGVHCKNNPCSFAHGEGELLIWTYEQQKKFMLNAFIQKLRKNNIVTNQMLAEAKSKNKYVPGLCSEKATSSPNVAPVPSAKSASKLDVSNSSQYSMPDKNGYTKISYIKEKHIVPSSLEPMPAKNNTNFPKFHSIDITKPVTLKPEYSYSQLAATPQKVTLTLNPALKPIHVEFWPFAKDENPLKKTHNFQMFCSLCFPPSSKEASSHGCLKNILAFAEKGTSHWMQVKERLKVRRFSGNYVLCDSITGKANQCLYGKGNCTYAHNTVEQALWNADKQEIFDLTKFILSHSGVKHRILDFIRRYGTSFSFICGECFKSSKQVIYKNDKKPNFCNGLMLHNWNVSKTLFYHTENRIIKKKKKFDKDDFYKRCFSAYCSQNNCSLAHSVIEREVWMLLRDTNITEEEFIDFVQSCPKKTTKDPKQAFLTPCPHKVEALCYVCNLKGKKIKHKQCGHSKESSGLVYFTNPGLKQIGNLPPIIPKNYYFTICRSIKNNKCQFPAKCTFAHSDEEISVWKWMCYNNIKKLDDIPVYQEKLSEEIVAGSSSILQSSTTAVTELPVPHNCQFCNVSCCNNMEWENHCATREHNANVICDQEQQWNYREPAWNLNEKGLKLCEKHKRGQCLYSNSLDMYNLCLHAHQIEELEEWKKRFEWRELKANMAKNPDIKSYIDKLQEKYFNASNPSLLMSENIPNIQLTLDGEKKVSSIQKKSNYTWTFTVTSKKHDLKKVALLHDKDRLYFKVSPLTEKQTLQVLDASKCKLQKNQWGVKVTFVGNMYGSFSQRIIFDFGTEPWLFQDLLVEVGTCHNLQRMQIIRGKTNFELWKPENREIISLPRTNGLLKKYKKPVNVENIVTQDVITTKLNRHNYVQKMHKLLYLEEFACQQKISRYNLFAEMTVLEIIQEESTIIRSQPNTLFGILPLAEDLSEDTDIGKMILTSCSSVYIASPSSDSKVYEVEIVMENNFNFKGYRRNKIYLSLSKTCILGLGLHSGAVKKVEVQFQLYRLSFSLMHFALDNLVSIDIVFPDPVKNVFSQNSKPVNCRSLFLNEEQMVAVKYILGQRGHFLCPFILNGAYGTGKTETLAQATMELLDTQPNCKILICTQCNSSADLFILKHLDQYMEKKNQTNSLLRVYYSGRHISTVAEVVRKYTLTSDDGQHFLNPRKEDIDHVRVVITTLEICYQLIKLQLKGTFTHIIIDEAAQEFECKVLLPLTMANKDTYIVLSGDHHQMGVKIHSAEARRQGFGKSIMQRLFEHYANHPLQNVNTECPLHTLLIHNYRSVREITRFISTCFYGIVTNLMTQNTLPSVSGLKPLQLYVVCGVEAHNANSTSYYNEAEVDQVVDCVHNISSNWPSTLGPFEPKDICIVSAYRDQVILIRMHLRRKGNLRQIVVEQIGNIPGKEFKVIIISTVRTRNCLDIRPDKLADYCDETDEPDFFFNKKLLNTAMTRAKYSVITIGDPVALCAYGKCSTIWRIFLNYCSKLCSVKPSTITYDSVRYEVNRLLSIRDKSSAQQADQENSSSLLPEPSKTQTEFPKEALNCTVAKPVDIKGYQLEAGPSLPTVITSSKPTTPEILQLDLNEAVPLNYPMSKMDSLFSVSKNATSPETVRINFSFPSVFAVESPTENFTIGLSIYKVDQHFILGVHWPDIQSYVPKENPHDTSASETVLALHPKQQLPNIPELYFTLDHTIGAMSCLMKVDREGKLLDCSFHQTLIKLQNIIPIEEIENYLEHNPNKQELNFLNYLQELTAMWCKLRLGNESLHSKDTLIDYPKSNRLLKEIFIQVHIQIVRFLSKVFPKMTPTAQLSFKEGPKLEQWKKEHVSDALNSIILLKPFLQGKTCQCNVFCKCLLDYIKQNELQSTIPQTLGVNLNTWQFIVNLVNSDKFEDAQDIILNPFYHYRIAVALKKLSDLSQLEFGCSDNVNATYNLAFDPQVYFCKPSISFLDLLVQRMLVAAIHKLPSPVTVTEIQEITKKLTESIKMKQLLQKEAFFEKLKKESLDQTILAQATIVSVTDSVIEILFPQLVSWSYFIELDMLGSRSMLSEICCLEFSQIEANALTYSLTSQNQATENRQKKIDSNQFTICIEATHWQRILSCLRCQDFYNLKNHVQSTNSSAVLKKELYLPDYNINSEVSYCLEVYPYLNLQASVKIVEDQEGHITPQVQLLHLTPNVSLCLLHRNKPLQCFLPSLPTDLSKHQQRLLTEVYHLIIAQHRSIILRDVTLVQQNQLWTFTIPSVFLKDHNISLTPDIGPEEGFLFQPLQNMICIRFSLMLAKNVKSTQVFHGYICDTKCSESNVTVVACVTDDTHSHLLELKKRNCNVEILCWKPIHRCMADSILNLEAASPLAKNIVSRQLKPVTKSTVVFSVLEANEFAIIASENTNFSLTYLMHWFEDYASFLLIKNMAKKSPILICTPNEHELDIIEDCLEMGDLFCKLDVVRVADTCEERLPSCTSRNEIFLHEKLRLANPKLMEEMNAMAEIYGNAFKQEHFIWQFYHRLLSTADVILCTCLTSHRSVIRSVSSIKQMIIFNAHLCSEVLAMIPISYYNVERLGLFCSSEPTPDTSIVHRVLQSCPQTKVIFQ